MARIVSGTQEDVNPGFAFLAGQQAGRQTVQNRYENAQRQAALMIQFQRAMQESKEYEDKRQQQSVDQEALGLAHQMKSRAIAGKFGPVMQKREGRARVYQGALARMAKRGASPEALEEAQRLMMDTESAARNEENEHYKRQTLERWQQKGVLQPDQVASLTNASPADIMKMDVDLEERERGENITAQRSARELEGAKMRLQAEREQAALRGEPSNPYTDALEGTIMTFEGDQDLWKDESHLNRFIQDTRWLQERAMKPGAGDTAANSLALRQQAESFRQAVKMLELEFGTDPFARTPEQAAGFNAALEALKAQGRGAGLPDEEMQVASQYRPLGQGLKEVGPILQHVQQSVAAGMSSRMSPSEIFDSIVQELNLDPKDPRVFEMVRTALQQQTRGKKPAKSARKR